ncbi:MAG: hypothetical protein ACYTEL_19735 [Planctomycetota bacterium]|jgi:hypothetical protein
MPIEAPLSKHKKTNFKIYIGVCLVGAGIFGYDGYLSKYEWSHRRSFYEKHVKDGKPDGDMVFNQFAPIFLVVLAGGLAARFAALKDKKLLAEDNELVLSAKETIPYDAIEKIDKTYFKSKGFFVIMYRNSDGRGVKRKLNDRDFDNLTAVLDQLVAKIS